MKIAFIPIDNRPICYDIIKDILSINSKIELFMPDIKYLGGLRKSADIDNIFEFIKKLVPSRRVRDSFDEIKKRILKFRESVASKCCKILAFSSIMRISNNNINEEEKTYWDKYGKKIFNWSYYSHKNNTDNLPLDVPFEIIQDYLETRKRNFEINKFYLELAKENFFDTLIFSKDDCAKYGLNIKEAEILEDLAQKNRYIFIFV